MGMGLGLFVGNHAAGCDGLRAIDPTAREEYHFDLKYLVECGAVLRSSTAPAGARCLATETGRRGCQTAPLTSQDASPSDKDISRILTVPHKRSRAPGYESPGFGYYSQLP